MYVCMYVGMHACMSVCMCVSMYACMYLCMYVCMYVLQCDALCVHVCIYVCVIMVSSIIIVILIMHHASCISIVGMIIASCSRGTSPCSMYFVVLDFTRRGAVATRIRHCRAGFFGFRFFSDFFRTPICFFVKFSFLFRKPDFCS